MQAEGYTYLYGQTILFIWTKQWYSRHPTLTYRNTECLSLIVGTNSRRPLSVIGVISCSLQLVSNISYHHQKRNCLLFVADRFLRLWLLSTVRESSTEWIFELVGDICICILRGFTTRAVRRRKQGLDKIQIHDSSCSSTVVNCASYYTWVQAENICYVFNHAVTRKISLVVPVSGSGSCQQLLVLRCSSFKASKLSSIDIIQIAYRHSVGSPYSLSEWAQAGAVEQLLTLCNSCIH
ncbi:hypothetical protein F5050DRAFT_642473 [Lentinula boryana]|uniref:Uncharacterized protein n=1 Tax=Lentinula boryana TaxID=40481 RepID=A0ABQ8Q5N2_9AGAR|nr:hypothetical protein F5050DRAFT_642473 [Lentinula boryana]